VGDNVDLSFSLSHMIVVFESRANESSKTTWKTDFIILALKWHLKVELFVVVGQPIEYFVSLYSNVGFSSKGSEDICTQNE